MQIYTVKQGDTIDRIAGAAGMDPLRLAHDNQIEPPYRLAVGSRFWLLVVDSEEAGGRLGRLPALAMPNRSRPDEWLCIPLD